MSYINIETKQIVEAQEIIALFPNVTFPMTGWTDELLAPFGFAEIINPEDIPSVGKYEQLQKTEPYQDENGQWFFSYAIKSLIPTDESELNQFILSEKQRLKQLATSERYRFETSGMFINGNFIKTDRESQAQLANAYAAMKNGLIESTEWKINTDNWVTLTLTEIEPIAGAVANHVRALFEKEKLLLQQINEITTVEQLKAFEVIF